MTTLMFFLLVRNLLMVTIMLCLNNLNERIKLINLVLVIKYRKLNAQIILARVTPKNRSREIFVIDFMLNNNPWT